MHRRKDRTPPANWQDFEDLCLKLWRPRLIGAKKHGRSGQPQAGVDIFGRDPKTEAWVGIQCKQRGQWPKKVLTASEIETEVEQAERFKPPLSHFIVATTAPRDAEVQRLVREMSDRRRSKGRFQIDLFSWDDLQDWLQEVSVPSLFWGVPKLPTHFLPPRHFNSLKKALLSGARTKLGLTASSQDVGVPGMGGIGKSVLAAAACRDSDVRKAFSDGVVWITVGPEPNIRSLQIDLATAFGVEDVIMEYFRNQSDESMFGIKSDPEILEQGARNLLAQAIMERSLLLVLDDVWRLENAEKLRAVDTSGQVLITTRHRQLLVDWGAQEIQMEVLSLDESRLLLANWTETPTEELPAIADRIAKACGCLPLALAMIGAWVRQRPSAWEHALMRLEQADLEKIRRHLPSYPYPDLLRALEVSVEALEEQDRERYIEIAAYSEEGAVWTGELAELWSEKGLSMLESHEVIDRLVARSLAWRDEQERVYLHDLQRSYLRRRHPEVVNDLQDRLVNLLGGNRALLGEVPGGANAVNEKGTQP